MSLSPAGTGGWGAGAPAGAGTGGRTEKTEAPPGRDRGRGRGGLPGPGGLDLGERIYQMASGGQVTIGEGYGSVTMSDGKGEEGEPLVVSLEAGRLWFVAGGERTDITDLVDEDTPYVHTYTDGEGVLHYFLVGGTPEDYGWFEGLKAPDGSGGGAGVLSSVVPEPGTVETAEEPGWYTAGTAQVQALWRAQQENKMGEAGGCQAARGLCSGRIPAHGPCAVASGLYGAHPSRPLCRGEAQTRPAFWGDCPPHPAQHMPPCTGAEERAPLYDPNRPPGERYGGSTPGGAGHSPPLHFLQNSVILHGKTGYREGAEQDGAAADHGHSGGAHLLSAHPKAGEKPQPPGAERSGEPVDPAGLPGRGGGRHGPGQMPVDHPGAGAAVGPGAGAAAGARPAECLRLLGRRWIGSILWCSPLGWPGRS